VPKKVGLILINYKDYAAQYLEACRDSLQLQTYPVGMMTVFIVDNSSSEASRRYLETVYPQARVLPRPDGNYTAASNLGMRAAIADGCEYLVTVNMDTEMHPEWLAELVAAMETNPDAGIAQSKILLYPQNEAERAQPRINSLGNIIHFLGFGFTDGYDQADREIIGYPEIPGYASGCSFIVRPAVVEKIGGYNEEFYMYHDDLEFSLKAKLAGYKIILAPRSVIFHKYEFKRSTKMIYYMERNRYLTMLSFYPGKLLFLISLPALFMDIGMFFLSIFSGWFRSEMRIYGYFFHPSTYAKIKKERESLKQLRIVSFSRIARHFSGRITFQKVDNPVLRYIVNPLLDIYWQLIKKLI
jgi:GT2 family glycosyltransferase